jgi:hypothetical protein
MKKDNSELKEKFLNAGGILLRKSTNSKGEPVIMHRKNGMGRFETRVTFTNPELRDKNFDYLITKDQFFKNDKD